MVSWIFHWIYMIFFIQCKERGKIKNKKPTCRERERDWRVLCVNLRSLDRKKKMMMMKLWGANFTYLYVGLSIGIGKWEVRIVDPTRWFAIFRVLFSSLGRIWHVLAIVGSYSVQIVLGPFGNIFGPITNNGLQTNPRKCNLI